MSCIIIGLTGGVATGKSTVLEMFRELGASVISADDIVHDLLDNDESVRHKVIQFLGPSSYKSDGKADRSWIAGQVFGNAELRKQLEDVLHPKVFLKVDEWKRSLKEAGALVGVAEIPLLFETDSTELFDLTVVVSAEHESQMVRLLNKGLTEAEAEGRISSQMPLSDKVRMADLVVSNDGDIGHLRLQVEDIWNAICHRSRSS